jgi:predicted nucleic acid-binding protein
VSKGDAITPDAITLDAGALVATERGDRRMTSLLALALARSTAICIPAGVIGQVWRGGTRQARLSLLFADPLVDIVPLEDAAARAAGVLCGLARTNDVIDASVVLCARERGRTAIVTSDPDDLARLDPSARLISI